MCSHCIIEDYIDIDLDTSKQIFYCVKCFTTFIIEDIKDIKDIKHIKNPKEQSILLLDNSSNNLIETDLNRRTSNSAR